MKFELTPREKEILIDAFKEQSERLHKLSIQAPTNSIREASKNEYKELMALWEKFNLP